MINLSEPATAQQGFKGLALFNLGFRPFFLGAGIFAILSIGLWSAMLFFQVNLAVESISIAQWHAHEMIYGYAMAVVAGFLLTAVTNWTGVQTIHGLPLMLVFGLWVSARLLFFFGTTYLFMAGVMDMLFVVLLVMAVGYPILKTKQWTQAPILLILIFLASSNLAFYLGAFNEIENGVYLGLYGGLYLVIGLILLMGGRVIPFFIERGVGYPVTLFNVKWLDIFIQLLFVSFVIFDLFLDFPLQTSLLAFGLFLATGVRLVGWHTPGIWKKSLLWSLYLSFGFISLGFLLFALIPVFDIPESLSIHAFAFGGLGVITMGMMSRIALGHSGMDVSCPPARIGYALGCLLAGAVFRVIVPLFDGANYLVWIGISQAFWIAGFAIFTLIYWPILIKARVDGRFG